LAAAARFASAADHAHKLQTTPPGDLPQFNATLRATETALLSPAGLPSRSWYKHTIYAPGEYTGYAAVVIPGVNEAIEAKDAGRATSQLGVLAQALDRAAQTLESAH
jgi:N-acetylated-alpha-linked acidic dipeptidase